MIRFLSIRNLAIVTRLELELEGGLTVLTGETGAGKSIIVNALALLMGSRAPSDVVRTGCDRAVVQASFDGESGGETIIRREITPQGRSRAFVDDVLTPLAALRTIGARLVDLHGQHEHQALLDPAHHGALLDAFAGLTDEVAALSRLYIRWSAVRRQLDAATGAIDAQRERQEILAFQRDEIDAVSPVAGEDEALASERTRLVNAERLGALSRDAYSVLYDRDDSLLTGLGRMWRTLDEVATLDPRFPPMTETRTAVTASLDDLAQFLRSYAADVDVAPDRLAEVESRLADLERLKRKYGGSLDAVLHRRETISAELDILSNDDARRQALAAELGAVRSEYQHAAAQVSAGRRQAASKLEAAIHRELATLAMPHARFVVGIENLDDDASRWRPTGIDNVEFLLSANPGEHPRPLARVASGGELSRVMLALKTLASTDAAGKTLVFDEVDAGVGGEAADRVGSRLRALGDRFQVLCVTHAPQLAAHATTHFVVTKRVEDGRTHTKIEQLSAGDRRARELARLMTGGTGTAAIASANELLDSKRRAKGRKAKAKIQRATSRET